MRVNYKVEYRSRYINFPMPVEKLKSKFTNKKIQLGNNDHVKWLSFLNHQEVNVFTLLYLYNRIDTYNDLRFDKFMALLAFSKPKNIAELIAAVDAVEKTALIQKFSVMVDDQLVAKEVSKQILYPSSLSFEPEDATLFSNEVKDLGIFETEYGYLLPLNYLLRKETINQYFVLQNLDPWLIQVNLQNDTTRMTLSLPLSVEELEIQINRFENSENLVINFDNIESTFFNTTVTQLKNLCDQLSIFELNELIWDLSYLNRQQLMKLEMLLPYIELDDIIEVYLLLENLNNIKITKRIRKGKKYLTIKNGFIEIDPHFPLNLSFNNLSGGYS